MTLSEKSQALRTEAFAILEGGVMGLLERHFGPTSVAGSAALDLMMVPDIDLYAQLEPTEAHKLYDLVSELAAQLVRQGFTLARTAVNDEYARPDPAFPDTPGLYGGFTFVSETQQTWKLDFWGWRSGQYRARRAAHQSLDTRLKTADRKLILRLKAAPGYGKRFFSMDVYDFVLAEAGETPADLERFVQARLNPS